MSNYNQDLLIEQTNRIAQLETALRFYADLKNWEEVLTGIGPLASDIEMDGGEIARIALKEQV